MKKLLLIFLTAIVLVGCQAEPITGETVSVTNGSYQNLNPTQLQTMLKDKDFVLVNEHIPFAVNLLGTDLSIPYNEIQQNLTQLPSDKNVKVVLYCSSGHMSQIAAEELVSLGYTNLWNLDGGLAAWQQAGFELEK